MPETTEELVQGAAAGNGGAGPNPGVRPGACAPNQHGAVGEKKGVPYLRTFKLEFLLSASAREHTPSSWRWFSSRLGRREKTVDAVTFITEDELLKTSRVPPFRKPEARKSTYK